MIANFSIITILLSLPLFEKGVNKRDQYRLLSIDRIVVGCCWDDSFPTRRQSGYMCATKQEFGVKPCLNWTFFTLKKYRDLYRGAIQSSGQDYKKYIRPMSATEDKPWKHMPSDRSSTTNWWRMLVKIRWVWVFVDDTPKERTEAAPQYKGYIVWGSQMIVWDNQDIVFMKRSHQPSIIPEWKRPISQNNKMSKLLYYTPSKKKYEVRIQPCQ